MTTTPREIPQYKKVREWTQSYGRPDVTDDRGVQDFMICETLEQVRGLQAELIAMADGRFDEKVLDEILGMRRKGRYGSYQAWAKLMLQWIQAFKV